MSRYQQYGMGFTVLLAFVGMVVMMVATGQDAYEKAKGGNSSQGGNRARSAAMQDNLAAVSSVIVALALLLGNLYDCAAAKFAAFAFCTAMLPTFVTASDTANALETDNGDLVEAAYAICACAQVLVTFLYLWTGIGAARQSDTDLGGLGIHRTLRGQAAIVVLLFAVAGGLCGFIKAGSASTNELQYFEGKAGVLTNTTGGVLAALVAAAALYIQKDTMLNAVSLSYSSSWAYSLLTKLFAMSTFTGDLAKTLDVASTKSTLAAALSLIFIAVVFALFSVGWVVTQNEKSSKKVPMSESSEGEGSSYSA
jgi:hypothetical protein